ncbi:MAG: hypothetical protein QOE26_2551 [Verrucomicrobiota bacterium]|jgi:hypothetical protein
MITRLGFFLILLYATAITAGRAELPPSAYKDWQEKAPEALVIKVQSVSKRETTGEMWKETDFMVNAEVQKVERSVTNLAPGATIEIRYSQRHYSPPIVGPSEVPALKEGQVCPAYLSAVGKTYSPAAGGYSFETVR